MYYFSILNTYDSFNSDVFKTTTIKIITTKKKQSPLVTSKYLRLLDSTERKQSMKRLVKKHSKSFFFYQFQFKYYLKWNCVMLDSVILSQIFNRCKIMLIKNLFMRFERENWNKNEMQLSLSLFLLPNIFVFVFSLIFVPAWDLSET